jgi:hypothetical protein
MFNFVLIHLLFLSPTISSALVCNIEWKPTTLQIETQALPSITTILSLLLLQKHGTGFQQAG